MSVPAQAVKRPITTIMVFAAFFVLGIISLGRIGQELFPDVELPTLIVITPSPGVGPSEIESTVTARVEDAVAAVRGVENIRSISMDSLSQVVVNFVADTHLDVAVTDVREVLNAIENDFPSGTQRSTIYRFDASQLPSLRLNLYTESPGIDIRRLVDSQIVPKLKNIKGVAQVGVFGGTEEAVLVELDLDSLDRFAVSIPVLMQVFQGENISLPGGTIRLDHQNLVLRTLGEFETIEDIGSILVAERNQVPIYLRDLANIRLGQRDQTEYVWTQGQEAIRLSIQKQSGFNTVQVNEAVLEQLDKLRAELPPSLKIEIQEDQAELVRESVGGVADSAWQGGLLAIMVLLFFLRNIRSTIIISTTIPVSIIATFSLIDFGGMTLNITSLMGITLAVGIFVDNAIVVLESIYRKQLSGMDPKTAAIKGTEEVSVAISASTLTTIAVFVPMIFVEGLAGVLFQDLSLTITFSLAMSLFAALTLVPVLCTKFLRVPPVSEEIRRQIEEENYELSLADVETESRNRVIAWTAGVIQNFLKWMDETYERAIRWSLRRSASVIIGALVLLVLSVASILLLGMEFIPEADESTFSVSMETRVGAPYSESAEKVAQIEEIVREIAGTHILALASQVGEGGSNYGSVEVRLVEKDHRDRSVWQIGKQVMQRVNAEVLNVRAELLIQGMASLASMASGGASPVVIRLAGDDIDASFEYAQTLVQQLRGVPGLESPRVDYSFGKPELQFRIKREEAISLGFSPMEIAASIRTAYNGHVTSTFSQEDEDYDILLILRPEDRHNRERILDLKLVNQFGTQVALENLVEIVEAEGPLEIYRLNRERYIDVLAGLSGERALNRVIADVEEVIEVLGPPAPGVELSIEGESTEMSIGFESLFSALLLAVALVYMVMASQFESFLNPLIVMFSIPFAIIGLVAALLLTNTTFNILSFTGAILLVGVVVNNAIVLIDYIHQLRQRGESLEQAIIKGGRTRLKPILMTTITTIFGLIPMAIGIGIGAELRAPMARAVLGGLSTSTAITLILIPTAYWLIEGKLKPWFERRKAPQDPIQAKKEA